MRKIFTITFVIATTMALSACITAAPPIERNSLPKSTASTSAIKNAKQGVAAQMKDPSSVQFKNVHGYDKGDADTILICGEVNAKNSFGGYTGFHEFTYIGGHLFVNKPAEGCGFCENPFNKNWNESCK